MATWLKQSTAVDIALGPFVDSTDGFTAETALTISQADVRLKKNANNWGQKSEATSATHEENGWYEVKLDTTDTNTLGILVVAVNETGALPVWREFLVLPANIYDSLVSGSASDYLQVDVAQISGSNVSTSSAQLGVNLVNISGSAVSTSTAQLGVNAVQAGATAWNSGAIKTTSFTAGAIDAAAIAADAIGASELATDAVTEIVGGVWNAARTSYTTAGSFGQGVASVQGNVTGSVGSVTGAVGSVTGAVGSVTGDVGGNVTGSVGSLAAQAKTDVNDQVVDALVTDTYAEPSGVPAATSSLKDKINWLFALARNKMTQTSTTTTLRNDADSGNISTSTVSDDGTTATRGEWA